MERPHVYAVPQEAIVEIGDQTYGYLLEDGKAVRTPVECGISDGPSVEIVKKRAGDSWHALTGSEEFIVGDLSEMVDGQTAVEAVQSKR